MKALTADMTTNARITETPRHNSASGYGRKIPTCYMLQIAKRWHRVYVMSYGNAGSSYVLIGGKVHFLSSSAELVLETIRDGGTYADAQAKLGAWPEWMLEGQEDD